MSSRFFPEVIHTDPRVTKSTKGSVDGLLQYQLCTGRFMINKVGVVIVEVDFDIAELSQEAFAQHSIELPAHCERMVAKRRCEYLAGRICSKQALTLLGYRGHADIKILSDRSPNWPDGFIGSITHTSDRAAACVARNDLFCNIGLDIERMIKPEICYDLSGHVLTKEDCILIDKLVSSSLSYSIIFTLIFSAKESLFKAIYKDVGYVFDFEEATVVSINKRQIVLRLNSNLSNRWLADNTITLQYMLIGHHVYTLALI